MRSSASAILILSSVTCDPLDSTTNAWRSIEPIPKTSEAMADMTARETYRIGFDSFTSFRLTRALFCHLLKKSSFKSSIVRPTITQRIPENTVSEKSQKRIIVKTVDTAAIGQKMNLESVTVFCSAISSPHGSAPRELGPGERLSIPLLPHPLHYLFYVVASDPVALGVGQSLVIGAQNEGDVVRSPGILRR